MKYAYWLSNIRGISKRKVRCLLQQGYHAIQIYEASEKELALMQFTEEEQTNIIESKKNWDVNKEWFSLMEKGIGFVSLEQEEYPKKLRMISNPPYSLYYIGKLPENNQKSVAIVGARTQSAYGSEVTEMLAKALSNHGVQVISGLAKGIDGDAHKGALQGSSDTFAVLGCGIDICYPKAHKYLYDKIVEKGGVLSEYPPQVPPKSTLFPTRNRIISGLSDCVVVMEAREKSGSLITADFAIEQGRDVYALPGRITDPLSAGCNRLIKQGAGIVQNVEDFIADLDIIYKTEYTQLDFYKNLLEKDELLVYSVTDFCPISLGMLIEKTNLPFQKVIEITSKLEQKGWIKEVFPNYYIKTIQK